MSSLNRADIIGNVGKDPEISRSQSGTRIANFSVATSEKWKDRSTGEPKEATEWHRVVAFQPGESGIVDVIESYVRKGSKVYVSGKIKTRKWQDQSGQDRYSTEIVLQGFDSKLVLLGEGGGGRRGPQSEDDYGGGNAYARAKDPESKKTFAEDIDDDIPFNNKWLRLGRPVE